MNKDVFDHVTAFKYSKLMAGKIFGYRHPYYQDAVSEGLIGAFQSLETYDPEKSTAKTWMIECIKYAVLSYMTDIHKHDLVYIEGFHQINDSDLAFELGLENKLQYTVDYERVLFSKQIIKLVNKYLIACDNSDFRIVLQGIYIDGKSLTDLAIELKYSVEKVRQLHEEMKCRIRRYLEDNDVDVD